MFYFKKPLVICILLVSFLVIIASLFCVYYHNYYKNIEGDAPIKHVDNVKPTPIDKSPQDDNIKKIKKNFIDDGVIDSKYSFKHSIYFLINQKDINKSMLNIIESSTKDNLDSRLAIVSGYACDLGEVHYNKRLIQDRINSVINVMRKINPSLDIIVANNGKADSIAYIKDAKKRAEKRAKERRVDIYFYK